MPGHYSLSAQEELIRHYCDTHGYVLTKIYADEGISASKALHKRHGIISLLEDAEKGEFDTIAFKDLTRWSRSPNQFYAVQDRLDKCKVSWISIEQPNLETVTAQGRLMVGIMISVASHEAAQTGERIKFVQQAQVRDGYYPFPEHLAAFGYTCERTDDGHMKLVPDPVKAVVVEEMYKTYALTGNYKRAEEKAVEMGYPMTKDRTHSILKNRKYIGEFRGIKNFCEPIISEELFEACQRLQGHRSYTNRRKTYVFSSLCRCGVCGGSMYGTTNTSSLAIWYRCDGCKHNMISQKKLEPMVIDEVDQYVHDLTIQTGKKTTKKKAQSVTKLRGKLDRLNELYIDGSISKGEYSRRKSDLEAQISEVNEVKDNVPKAFNGPWKEAYNALDNAKRNVLWKSVIDRIVINGDKTISIIFSH